MATKRARNDSSTSVPNKKSKGSTPTVQSTLSFGRADGSSLSPKFCWVKTYENDRKELSCYYGEFGSSSCDKVAAFDLDGTLILHKSGNIAPKSPDDWDFLFPDIQARLEQLHEEGYEIVIFTNQNWKDETRWKKAIGKIDRVVNALNIPVKVFVARRKDVFRKPENGMWKRLTKYHDGAIDKDNSFYVGDAAGRVGDHSDADKGFAARSGLRFLTPEEFFLDTPSHSRISNKQEKEAIRGRSPHQLDTAKHEDITETPLQSEIDQTEGKFQG